MIDQFLGSGRHCHDEYCVCGIGYPLGRLADRMSRSALLVVGVGFLIAADIVLATAGTVWQVVIGAALWGAHMGATQGLLSVLVADAVPENLRGTAFRLYSLITGAAVLAASVIHSGLGLDRFWSLGGFYNRGCFCRGGADRDCGPAEQRPRD